MIKDITFGDEAQQKIKAGVDKLANVVKSTLGPGGSNVILQRGHLNAITKDGVSVAREVWLDDPIENIGAQVVKEAAERTVREAGDGTTTATVLAQAIFSEGVKESSTRKKIDIKRGIDKAVGLVVGKLREMAKPVVGDDIKKVALISSNGDQEIGGLVGDAIAQVGLDGMVSVEESRGYDTYLKKVEGMRWDRGYLSPYFITNPEKAECVLEDPLIIIYDGNIQALREIMGNDKYNIMDRIRGNADYSGKPLLFICHDAGAEFISVMSVNHRNKAIQCCIVQAPEFQDTRKHIMHDIAAMTGGTVISKEAGLSWNDVKYEHLGRAGRVRVTQWNTTIIDGHGGMKASIRANEIKEQMNDANDHALAVLKSRLARLVNGLMVIYVGGASDVEISEKKDRIDDALNATRAAIEEGVLPGGGLAYINARNSIDWSLTDFKNEDEACGMLIVKKALSSPMSTILENVGEETALTETVGGEMGFNAQTMHVENLIEAGIIDPVKVTRLALENGASVAGMLLTTKGVVSNKQMK